MSDIPGTPDGMQGPVTPGGGEPRERFADESRGTAAEQPREASAGEHRERYADQPRETFAETLAAIAEAGRARMRPTPLAEIGARRRRRRTRRATLVATAAATTCAVALGVALAASPAAKKPSLPPVGPTPTYSSVQSTTPSSSPDTPATPTTPATPATAEPSRTSAPSTSKPTGGVTLPAQFLAPQELPEPQTFAWSADYSTPVHLQTPLPTTCDHPLGPQAATTDVHQARYSSPSGPETITETVFTYDTAAHAADKLARITPACGPGYSVHTDDGFGWAEAMPAAGLTDHLIVARRGNRIAAFEYLEAKTWRAYSTTIDGEILTTMVNRLQAASVPDNAILSADQIPFPDGGKPWQSPGEDAFGQQPAVTDVCASAADPVDTTSKNGHPAPDSLDHFWTPGDVADVSPAQEAIHVFASATDAMHEYQKAKALHAAQTCHLVEDTVGDVTSTITPGGSIATGNAQGFAVGRSDSYNASSPTGTMNQFRTYVVLKGNIIAVLSVPVTKDHVADSSGDGATLTTIAGRLP